MIDLAHIHPMLVHFPIVLLLMVVAVDFVALQRNDDLASNQVLPNIALVLLVLGTLAAIAASSFGDIAMDEAISKGFLKPPLEEHEELGFTTMWIFIGLTVARLVAWRAHFSLTTWRGWTLFVAGVVGAGILLVTAYHGGHLVYELGVNVAPVHPVPTHP